MNIFYIFIVAAVVVFFFVEFFIRRRRRGKLSQSHQDFIAKSWKVLREDAKHSHQQAIIEADKLLDFALKCRGYQGTLGEKLTKAEAEFSDNDGVWSAHKLRNRLSHEVGFRVTAEQTQAALSQFHKALRDLGVE